jgi:Protein of unknown function (DUF4065)
MANLRDLLIYMIEACENEQELTKTRVTKLVYLCDWKYSLEYGQQMTNIDWVFDNYGPFVWDVMKVIENNTEIFQTRETTNSSGSNKTIVSLNTQTGSELANLTGEERKVLQFVINSTKDMGWSSFIKLVYSTYPVVASMRHEKLNLVDFAREYKETPFYKNTSPEIEYKKLDEEKDDDF